VSHERQSQLWFVFGLNPVPSNTGQDCVTTALKSARSQISAVLFYAQTMKFVQAWICADPMRVSCLQAKGHYLKQNIGLTVAESAGPAPPSLILPARPNVHTVCMCLYLFADVKNVRNNHSTTTVT